MTQRFELRRVFSMSSPRGVDRIVTSMFASSPAPHARGRDGVVVRLVVGATQNTSIDGSSPSHSTTSP